MRTPRRLLVVAVIALGATGCTAEGSGTSAGFSPVASTNEPSPATTHDAEPASVSSTNAAQSHLAEALYALSGQLGDTTQQTAAALRAKAAAAKYVNVIRSDVGAARTAAYVTVPRSCPDVFAARDRIVQAASAEAGAAAHARALNAAAAKAVSALRTSVSAVSSAAAAKGVPSVHRADAIAAARTASAEVTAAGASVATITRELNSADAQVTLLEEKVTGIASKAC